MSRDNGCASRLASGAVFGLFQRARTGSLQFRGQDSPVRMSERLRNQGETLDCRHNPLSQMLCTFLPSSFPTEKASDLVIPRTFIPAHRSYGVSQVVLDWITRW